MKGTTADAATVQAAAASRRSSESNRTTWTVTDRIEGRSGCKPRWTGHEKGNRRKRRMWTEKLAIGRKELDLE